MKTMTIVKIWASVILTLVIGFGGVFTYHWAKKYFHESELKMTKLAEDIASSRIQQDQRVFDLMADNLDRRITDDARRTNQRITDIGSTVVDLKQTVETYKNADHGYKEGTGDTNEQYYYEIPMKDSEGNEIAVAWFIIFPNREPPDNVKSGIKPNLKVNIKNVLMEGDDYESAIVQAWMGNNKGDRLKLNIESVKWAKEPEISHFEWNPRLSLSFNAGTAGPFPSLDMSLFTYGKESPDWRFLKFGIGYSEDIDFLFAPIGWNFAEPLPFAEEIFIDPYGTVNAGGEQSIGIGVSVLF